MQDLFYDCYILFQGAVSISGIKQLGYKPLRL